MNKFIKTLIIINGIIIPIVILTIFFFFMKEVIFGPHYKSDSKDGVNLKNKEVNEAGDTLILQGIDYYEPQRVYNSEYYYMAIEPKTYEQPENIGRNSKFSRIPALKSSHNGCLNYIFLDKDFNCIGKLVNKKASVLIISQTEYYPEKVDTTIKNIAYLISYSDSNNDGLLNELDKHDLYISNLNGSNLVKVTNDLEIVNCSFINNNRELLITFKDNDAKKNEYKNKRFAVYNIKQNRLKILTSIDDSINEILGILNKK